MNRLASCLASCVVSLPLLGAASAPADALPSGSPLPSAATQADMEVHGSCWGGGRLTLSVHPRVDGTVRVTATASNLPRRSRWSGALNQSAVPGGIHGHYRRFEARAVDGVWSVAAVFGPQRTASYAVSAFGPGRHTCQAFARPGRSLTAISYCRWPASMSLFAEAKTNGRTVVRAIAALGRPRPGSEWSLALSWTAGHTGTGTATQATMDHNAVRTRASFRSTRDKRIRFSVTGPEGQTCALRVRTATVR